MKTSNYLKIKKVTKRELCLQFNTNISGYCQVYFYDFVANSA